MIAAARPADRLTALARAFRRRRVLLHSIVKNKIGLALRRRVTRRC